MAHIIAAQSAFPTQYYAQHEILSALSALLASKGVRFDADKLQSFFENVGVRHRHLALPFEGYLARPGFAARNAAWLEVALGLGERAVTDLLARADLGPKEVDLFVSTTVTGIAVPSLDARLMNRLAFRTDTRRLPLFGLGCVAGAAGIARIADYLRGNRQHAAILLSVELCSLTLQQNDPSIANLVASALFGDGSAAVLVVGDEHPKARQCSGPRVVASRSVFFPNTERVMGWDVVDNGFQVVLGKGVPILAGGELPRAVSGFLSDHKLGVRDIDVWLTHPGGPAVIEAIQNALELEPAMLERSRQTLEKVGNLSSASVLVILEDTLSGSQPAPGSYGMLMAMGPGFCAELVLLKW